METVRPAIRKSPISLLLLATTSSRPDLDLLARWHDWIEKAPAGSELLVIDDHIRPAAEFVETRSDVRTVRHCQPLGLGACVQTGLWLTQAPLVLLVSVDRPQPIEPGSQLFDQIDEADLVVGCRSQASVPFVVRLADGVKSFLARIFLGYAPEPRMAWPGWSGAFRRWIARRFFGVPVLDPLSGILLARREIFAHIPLQSKSSFTWVEVLAKANHLGCLLSEAPVVSSAVPNDPFARDAWCVFRNPDFGPPPCRDEKIKRAPKPTPGS